MNHKEGWAPKNWCFQIVVLEKILESLLCSTEIKPINLKGNQPDYSLEGLVLKLKLQYFGHLMGRVDSLEKTLMMGKIESRRRRGDRVWDGRMASLAQWTWAWANSRRYWRQGSLVCWSPWGCKELDTTEWLTMATKSWTKIWHQRQVFSQVTIAYDTIFVKIFHPVR